MKNTEPDPSILKNIDLRNFDREIRPTPAELLDIPQTDAEIPPEIERLKFLVGSWDVKASFRFRDTWVQIETQSVYRPILDGTMLEEKIVLDIGGTMKIWAHWCWDRYLGVYRVVRNDNLSGRSNIYEGDFSGDVLVMTNLRSDTAHVTPERRKHGRLAVRAQSEDAHVVISESSIDGGETWTMHTRYEATRRVT